MKTIKEAPSEEVQAEIEREVDITTTSFTKETDKRHILIRPIDMLYHDIKSGNLADGSWVAAIDKVKEAHPKPEGPEPEL